jgi:FAD/FMN-containing dehydrogenase
MATIRNWAGERAEGVTLARPRDHAEVRNLVARGDRIANFGGLRSYSDICLPGSAIAVDHAGRGGILQADWQTGRLVVDAGMRLKDLCAISAERGWMPFVVPGTGEATIGGCVANDVHGKNHVSAGSFGDHVETIRLARSTCDRDFVVRRGDPLFGATVGGLGLTGAILDVGLRLVATPSAYLEVETTPLRCAADYCDLENRFADREFRAAWIDLTDRAFGGICVAARWARDGDYTAPPKRSLAVPFELPFGLVSEVSTKAFNWGYRARSARTRVQRLHFSRALWPLDAVKHWNRLYGPDGFLQYQVVTPDLEPLLRICEIARSTGLASPLTVLKTFGDRKAAGWLSFPRRGYTLAVDFRLSQALPPALEEMDAVVRKAGGAWYPAKYRWLRRPDFLQAFPRWRELLAARDPAITSSFYERMRL